MQVEEEYLIDLLHEEEMAERRRTEAEVAAAKREAGRREMMAANAGEPSNSRHAVLRAQRHCTAATL